jgi:hypothetical protein
MFGIKKVIVYFGHYSPPVPGSLEHKYRLTIWVVFAKCHYAVRVAWMFIKKCSGCFETQCPTVDT